MSDPTTTAPTTGADECRHYDEGDTVFIGPLKVYKAIGPEDYRVCAQQAAVMEGFVGIHYTHMIPATAVPDAGTLGAIRALRAIAAAVLSGDESEAWTKAVNARDDNDLARADAWLAQQEGRDGNG